MTLRDADGKKVKTFDGSRLTLAPGETGVLKASERVGGLNFWSWGYGYLYDVDTELVDDKGRSIDKVTTRTGFRKTRFGEGKIWLNDRLIQIHGYAQRTSNEWPAVGLSVPAWLSDYSNGLMVESGGNLVRWMHVTPGSRMSSRVTASVSSRLCRRATPRKTVRGVSGSSARR